MLADKMVELDVIASVSHEAIRRALKKMNLNPGKLRIDTLCHESFVSQKVVRLSHLTFRKQNMPQTIQNKDQFGLNWQALRVKDGTMSTLPGSLHSPIKDKCVK